MPTCVAARMRFCRVIILLLLLYATGTRECNKIYIYIRILYTTLSQVCNNDVMCYAGPDDDYATMKKKQTKKKKIETTT